MTRDFPQHRPFGFIFQTDAAATPPTTDILTLLGYKGKKKNARKKEKQSRPLVAAHTDVGVITILLYEPDGDCAKLQRKKRGNRSKGGGGGGGEGEGEEEEWIDVSLPPLQEDPMFVVNIGDCLSEMTNGELRSTLHRVVLTGGARERQCLAMFVGLNSQVVMRVHSSEADGETRDMTYEEWRRRRVKRAQAILKKR